jgi:hypothetical protein
MAHLRPPLVERKRGDADRWEWLDLPCLAPCTNGGRVHVRGHAQHLLVTFANEVELLEHMRECVLEWRVPGRPINARCMRRVVSIGGFVEGVARVELECGHSRNVKAPLKGEYFKCEECTAHDKKLVS